APAAIVRRHRPRRPSDLTVIALVAVQTNQWPRAADLALEFRRRGLPVLVGGFHVSGVLELFPDPTPELAELLDAGVTLVHGEIEETWGGILKDALSGHVAPRYDLHERPGLQDAPRPPTP